LTGVTPPEYGGAVLDGSRHNAQSPGARGVDPTAFRDALALFPAGVTVVSTMSPDGPYGTTVTAFSALSLDPPMVLTAFGERSRALAHIRREGRFGVSFLSADHTEIARELASTGDKSETSCDWELRDGLPVVAGARVQLLAEACDLHRGGDHFIVCGRVTDSALRPEAAAPLVYYGRTFLTAA
jgi:flavin reductase (DIM6/NTAB) family NADH-FMN oxidoreductase RutF